VASVILEGLIGGAILLSVGAILMSGPKEIAGAGGWMIVGGIATVGSIALAIVYVITRH
jgi:hypothetical protein